MSCTSFRSGHPSLLLGGRVRHSSSIWFFFLYHICSQLCRENHPDRFITVISFTLEIFNLNFSQRTFTFIRPCYKYLPVYFCTVNSRTRSALQRAPGDGSWGRISGIQLKEIMTDPNICLNNLCTFSHKMPQ